ncbi:MAG: Uma2 family endonuclease [Deltaproteobacteria bacterium]|nr:Uma2 family endonuclease [Deltaproteobacteria bacterium]
MSTTTSEPAWEVAKLFPDQGSWSEEEYLALGTNRLVEYSHGSVEVLPMPTQLHQAIVGLLYSALVAFTRPRRLGSVLFAPLRVRLWPGKLREPDVVFMLAEHAARRHEEYWEGADLVMEVVSDDDRRRDIEIKRREYSQAGIPEYWIVDPLLESITVLRLEGGEYAVHGTFARGAVATSPLLAGLEVPVDRALIPEDV